jgi:signal transduction histidine kinase
VNRIRWLTVLLPVALVGTIELVSDSWLDPYFPFPLDTLLVMLVVLAVGVVLSRRAFQDVDRLGDTLRARNAELEARHATARGLQQVSVAITALADLDAILQATVDNARTLLAADVAFLILSGPGGSATLRAASGPLDSLDATGGQPGDDVHRFVRESAATALVQAPLRRGDVTIGTLAVRRGEVRSLRIGDAETLSSLASQAAIAIENDRLQTELRELAVRDERERIARELHDGLAQVLGYVNTKSQAVEELLAADRVPEARAQLAELAAAARSIYVDVREAILGLSSPVAPAGGLIAALRAYGRRFAEASKLAVRVDATAAAGQLGLDPTVDDEVFRIAREALTNVRKHAAARRVAIRVTVEDAHLVVEIEDDGRGFDPVTIGATPGDRTRLGLAGIRERAAAIGGRVEWRPAPGGGTIVHVAVPMEIGAVAEAWSAAGIGSAAGTASPVEAQPGEAARGAGR